MYYMVVDKRSGPGGAGISPRPGSKGTSPMTSTSVACETITRKALRLYPERVVEPLGHGRYSVEGTSESYEVDLGVFGGPGSCDCPASKPCYHIGMATLYRARKRGEARRKTEARRAERVAACRTVEAL